MKRKLKKQGEKLVKKYKKYMNEEINSIIKI